MNPLSLLALIPQRFIVIGAMIALSFILGMGVANHWATKRALDYERDRAAREQAAVSRALIEANKENVAKINAAVKLAHDADMKAHEDFRAQVVKSDNAKASAEKRLQAIFADYSKLQKATHDLQTDNRNLVSAMASAPPPGCVMPPDVRRVLDQASGAADPGYPAGADNPASYPAPGADGAPNPSAVLTCEQLADGYVALGSHGRYLAAELAALQAWVSIVTRP